MNDNIDKQEESINKKLYTTKLLALDKLVISNNYEKVLNSVKNGETLFKHNRLCNGLYMDQIGKHPKLCRKQVCYRTALFYALKNNCYAYMSIYKTLILIFMEYPEIHKGCKCCNIKIDENYLLLHNTLIDILDRVWNIKCECVDKFFLHKTYKSTFLNFTYMDKILKNIPIITDELIKICKTNNTITDVSFYDDNFSFCIHHDMKKYINILNHQDITVEHNKEKIGKINRKLIDVYNWYIENTKICKLLFNLQALEIFKHNINTNVHVDDINKQTNDIYNNNDLDIDFYTSSIKSALEMCLENDLSSTVDILLQKKAKLVRSDIFFNALQKKNYRSCIKVIDLIDSITDNICNTILLDTEMDIELKNNFFQKFIDLGYKFESNIILNLAIQLPEHNNIVNTLLSVIKPEIADVYIAIEYNKQNTFKIILDNGFDINSKSDNYDPIIFGCLNNPDLLSILFEHNPDIDVLSNNNETCIWRACLSGCDETTQLLLDRGSDYAIRDETDNTLLMIGMYNEYIISPLLLKQDILNSENNIGYTLPIAAVYTRNPLPKFNKLITVEGINFNHTDKNGLTVIDHIIICKTMTSNKKTKILEKVLPKIDFTLKPKDGKPFLVKAIEVNDYIVTKCIFEYLLKTGKLELSYNGQIQNDLVKSFTLHQVSVKIKMKYDIDIYTLVYNYLKQLYLSGNHIEYNQYINWYIIGSLIGILFYTETLLSNKKLII
jgi:hypothetical protein